MFSCHPCYPSQCSHRSQNDSSKIQSSSPIHSVAVDQTVGNYILQVYAFEIARAPPPGKHGMFACVDDSVGFSFDRGESSSNPNTERGAPP